LYTPTKKSNVLTPISPSLSVYSSSGVVLPSILGVTGDVVESEEEKNEENIEDSGQEDLSKQPEITEENTSSSSHPFFSKPRISKFPDLSKDSSWSSSIKSVEEEGEGEGEGEGE
jgi:hypothetical protein